MTLPSIDLFDEFLSGTEVTSRCPESGRCESLQHPEQTPGPDGVPLWISFPASELQPESVLRKIEEALVAAGSPTDRRIVLALLAIIVESSDGPCTVKHANEVLTQFRDSQFHFNAVLPTVGTVDIKADYGVLQIAPFNPATLEYWATRGRSAWPFALGELAGRTCVSRRFDSVTLINFDRLPGRERFSGRWPLILAEFYYQAVADVLRDQLERDFAEQIVIAEAAGIHLVELSSLFQLATGIHLFASKASVRPGDHAGTWAICSLPGFHFNTSPGSYWEAAKAWIVDEYGFDEPGGVNPMHDVGATYARLMQNARKHLGSRHVSEAFLYFVIALDQLLGEDGRNTMTVVDRASALTHRRSGSSFEEERIRIRRLYDKRSRFVHDGEPVGGSELAEVDEVCRNVLWSVLGVCRAGVFTTRAAWVEKIDRLVLGLAFDHRVVPAADLDEVGAQAGFKSGPPPPMVSNP